MPPASVASNSSPGRRERVAFVFPGGAARGATQVGMLQALTEHGVRPSVCVGSSVGAIHAAHFARHPDGDGLPVLAELWGRIGARAVFPASVTRLLRGAAGLSDGFVSRRGLRRMLEQEFGEAQLEDSPVDTRVVAADVATGERVVIGRGRAVDAIMASAAIPGVFAPVEFEGRRLADAALAANTPVRSAYEERPDRILVLSTGCTPNEAPRGAVGLAMHALELLIAHQLRRDLAELQPCLPIHLVPPVCPAPTSLIGFGAASKSIELAYESTAAWIDAGGLDDTSIPQGVLEPIHTLPWGAACRI